MYVQINFLIWAPYSSMFEFLERDEAREPEG